jgi:hypothetical protein
MRMIGLAGWGGTGKDTVADILVADHGYTKFSFSDALYKEVSDAYGVPVAWLQDRAIKEVPQAQLAPILCKDENFVLCLEKLRSPVVNALDGLSPREVLQWWGTEYRRAQDPSYWLKRSDETVAKAQSQRMVNTSVRFENELDFIRKYGGEVWCIQRNVPRPNGHAAEKGIGTEHADRVVMNLGSIEELRALVRDILWDFKQ